MKKVYIMGYYGYQNAGDDAMLLGLCDELNRQRVPFRFYFKGDGLCKVLRNITQADIVTIGGGTHLRDWGKGWLLQSLRIVCLGLFVKLIGKQFHMWNVGIDGDFWLWIMKKICNFISIRDEETFDNAMLINWQCENKKQKIVGVNITPVNKIYYGREHDDMFMQFQLLRNIERWLGDNPGWRLRVVSFNNNTKYKDINATNVENIEYDGDPIHTLNKVAECSVFISMRYHSAVFAYMAKVPCVVIDVYPSTSKFLSHQLHLDRQSVHMIGLLLDVITNKKTVNTDGKIELARKGIKV